MGAYTTIFLSTVLSLMTKVYVLYSSDLPFVATLGWPLLLVSVLLDFVIAGRALMNIYEGSAHEQTLSSEDLIDWMLRSALLLLLDVVLFLLSIWTAKIMLWTPWANFL